MRRTKYGTKISIIKSLSNDVYLVEAIGRYGSFITICLKEDIE